jgi:hypothetical protein
VEFWQQRVREGPLKTPMPCCILRGETGGKPHGRAVMAGFVLGGGIQKLFVTMGYGFGWHAVLQG